VKIKELVFYFIKKKKIKSNYPLPFFYKNGIIVIKLISDNGCYGYGEPSPYFTNFKKLIKDISILYIKFFKNKNIKLINISKIKKKIKSREAKGLLSSFDQAILDIVSKEKNVSLPKLFTKKIKNKTINLYASGGMIFNNQSYSKTIDEAVKMENKGFFGYKFRPKFPKLMSSHENRIKYPPSFEAQEFLMAARNIKKKVSSKFKLMVDLGCRIKNIKEASYIIEALEDLDFYFIEEPIQRKIEIYKEFFQKKKKIKIAGGEHIFDFDLFKKIKKNNIFDFYQPDSNLLLFSELKKISNQLGKKKIIMHNWCNSVNFASNLSFAFSLKKKILVESNIIKNPYKKIFKLNNYEIYKGKSHFKETPGLGVEMIEFSKDFEVYEKKI
tara:strand:- start:34663 stop:35814 length:1152 start_codon:yes stop_codon:yes gene_type:complete